MLAKPSPIKAPRKTPQKEAGKKVPPALVPEVPTLPMKTGRVRVEVQPDNYHQKLPLELGKAADGSLLVDLRKGFSCLLVLPGDKVIRVSIQPENVMPVTRAVEAFVSPAPVIDPLDKLLEDP